MPVWLAGPRGRHAEGYERSGAGILAVTSLKVEGKRLFDQLVARAADRRRADTGAIIAEVRTAAEARLEYDELRARSRVNATAARVGDGLVGEIDGPGDVLRRSPAERIGSARRRVPILENCESRGRPRRGRSNRNGRAAAEAGCGVIAARAACQDDRHAATRR